ncbi:response regulator [Burkholderia sp. FERM BP-3421]|jgi:two-component system chemotaxis response regulator CheY|uniref:response regulator n=1 Tax=Burkholderia sp. FERM BP-3421 TaxID=1494466 RepID=UPI0023615CB0|nr:response regulator [Burkholderia sp. FERM BP-3421]WDD95972.1 response regulator [Burkholderia sp. FERM BP-3421]
MIRTILAIDDSATMRALLQATLTEAGYDVTVASDGEVGLEIASVAAFDLVVTDHHMPRKNGLEVIAALREKEHYASIPILVLTTEDGDAFKAAARESGATGWIQKPLDPETLLDLVAALAPSHP